MAERCRAAAAPLITGGRDAPRGETNIAALVTLLMDLSLRERSADLDPEDAYGDDGRQEADVDPDDLAHGSAAQPRSRGRKKRLFGKLLGG